MPVRVGETRIKKTKSGEKIAKFSEELEASRVRVTKLLEPSGDQSVPPEDVLTELRAQNEALSFADEELRAQCEELVRYQRRLEVERRRYRDLFDLSPDALIVTDRRGLVQEANTAACALLGIDARFLRGKPLVSYLDSESRKTFYGALESLSRMQGVDLHLTFVGRGEGEKPVTLRGAPMKDPLFIVWSARERSTSNASSGCGDSRDESLRRLSRESEHLLATTREWTKKLREPELTLEEREHALAAIDRSQTMHANLTRKAVELFSSVVKPREP